ncbi:MAG TPA: translesion DNA synthesis-associated protein ImuA [Gammaproteobacteria bacterium]|nr:translesion DNA synthesis-associated protein ImuA [Gammaproteobacteria bacterium]
MKTALNTLLARPDIWRGGFPRQDAAVATGHADLDAALGGGWPARGLIEVLHETHGGGELTVLAPLLGTLAAAGRQIVFVDPPFLPYAPALASQGFINQLLLVQTGSDTDSLWTAETCLRAGCGAVLCWLDRPTHRALRRLQLAAEDGEALALLFRPLRAAGLPSPAVLRLAVQPGHETGLIVNLLKCRSRPAASVCLPDPAFA